MVVSTGMVPNMVRVTIEMLLLEPRTYLISRMLILPLLASNITILTIESQRCGRRCT